MEEWNNGMVEDLKDGGFVPFPPFQHSTTPIFLFLNIALGSAGESVSGLHVYVEAEQITVAQFDELDALAYKLENGLKRLIESLQIKQNTGGWQDSFVVRESNAAYGETKDE